LSSLDNYQLLNDRIGTNPYMYIQEGVKSFDIDWPEQFEMAENLFSSFKE